MTEPAEQRADPGARPSPRQLALQLVPDARATFDSFIPGANGATLSWLTSQFWRQSGASVYLWGPRGSGRTHLLQACCHAARDTDQQPFLVPLRMAVTGSAQALEELAEYPLVCLDDLDAVVGNRAWEEAVLYLFNRLQARSHRVLVSASRPPALLGLGLADLSSRMAGGLVLSLEPMDDGARLALLSQRADSLGMRVAPEVWDYVLRRSGRETAELLEHLERIDRVALERGRRITIPLVKEVLGW